MPRPPGVSFSRAMEHPQFTLDYLVLYYDTDCGGIVHNLAYLRWVEECRSKMGLHIGIDFAAMAREGRHLVLVRHEVDYHSPAVLADAIRIQGCLEQVEKSSLWFRFEVRRADDDRLCVTVRQRLALVQMPKGRPCRLPAEWVKLAATA